MGRLAEHIDELVQPVRGANLVGDGPTILARVDAVGTDFDGMMTQNWAMPAPKRLVAQLDAATDAGAGAAAG